MINVVPVLLLICFVICTWKLLLIVLIVGLVLICPFVISALIALILIHLARKVLKIK